MSTIPAPPAKAIPQSNARTANHLLASLTPQDFALLLPDLVPASFAIGEHITAAGSPIDRIVFIEQGVAGVLDALDEERRYAIGLIGAEGYIGWPLLLGADRSPYDVAMRAESGRGLSIASGALLAAIDRSASLRMTMLRFAHLFGLQMAQTIVSSLTHSIAQRMARWILLYHDRVQGDEICMTHEEFRLMLGVRRSSVTDALHRLEEERAVRATRGRVVVLDRATLITLAEGTYGRPEQEYGRLMER